jgi:hypothetical protein
MGAKDDKTPEVQETKPKKRSERKFDPSVLRPLLQEGLDAATIMERLGVKHKQTLKQFILKLIHIDRTLYDVKGLYLKDSKRPCVNQFGFLKINLKVQNLGDLTVEEGDQFDVEIIDSKIVLTKLIP